MVKYGFVLGNNTDEVEAIKKVVEIHGLPWVQPPFSPNDPMPCVSSPNAVPELDDAERIVFVECVPGRGWLDGRKIVQIEPYAMSFTTEPRICQVRTLLENHGNLSAAQRREIELVVATALI